MNLHKFKYVTIRKYTKIQFPNFDSDGIIVRTGSILLPAAVAEWKTFSQNPCPQPLKRRRMSHLIRIRSMQRKQRLCFAAEPQEVIVMNNQNNQNNQNQSQNKNNQTPSQNQSQNKNGQNQSKNSK